MVARGAVSAANRRRRLALRAAQMYPIFRLHRSNHAEVARSICTTRCADAIQRRSTTSATRSASAIPPSFATCIRAPPGRPGNRARIVLLAPDVAVPGDQTAPGHRRARQPGRLAAAAEEGSSPRQHSPGSAAVHDSGGMPDPAQAAADIVPHRNPLSGTGGSNPALSSGESVANSVIAKAGPCGTTASVFTFLCLRELRDELHGRLTLSAVSQMRTAASDDASASCNALNQPDPLNAF